MKDLNRETLTRLRVIKDSDPQEVVDLYEKSLVNFELSVSDYLTIRDLVEITGYDGVEVQALLLVMFAIINEGSVCLFLQGPSFEKRFARLVSDPKTVAGKIKKQVPSLNNLVSVLSDDSESESADFKPLIYVKKRGALYFQRYYEYEKRVKLGLVNLMEQPLQPRADQSVLAEALEEVLIKNPLMFQGRPLAVNAAQVMALTLPLFRNFTIISGGPGTGKTSIVLNILRLFARSGMDVSRMAVGAPTGRAAQRITESLGRGLASLKKPGNEDLELGAVKGSTIHRMLRYSPGRNDFIHNADNPLSADLVIIDEVSMVDIVLLGKLLQAVPDGACLVFLGDRNQLPSVEAGAVLADLLPHDVPACYSDETVEFSADVFPALSRDLPPSPRAPDFLIDRFVVLTESYRSQKEILDAAEKINSRDTSVSAGMPLWKGTGEDSGVFRIEPPRDESRVYNHFNALIEEWVRMNYLASDSTGISYLDAVKQASHVNDKHYSTDEFTALMKKVFTFSEGARILSPVKHGFSGTEAINRRINTRLSSFDKTINRGAGACSGQQIMIVRNDYQRNLYNGDTGVVIVDNGGSARAFFPRGDSFVFFPLSSLPLYVSAFAITVHKSQGSEYERVLLIVDEGGSRLLTREMLYTAFTRARSTVFCYGSVSAISRAIESGIVRESGIDLNSLI